MALKTLASEPSICTSVDGDGDGFTVDEGDCDDTDPDVYPGATEVCNNVDDNCDGAIDEGIADIETGTNVGECQVEIQSCIGGIFTETQPGIDPAPEVCDGLDNNCNGTTDEGFDADNDGITDCTDACPLDADNDADGDGVCGDVDICNGNDAAGDTDSDGVCDDNDADDDNDGVEDVNDACPLDPTESSDNDGDGTGDNADLDDDNRPHACPRPESRLEL